MSDGTTAATATFQGAFPIGGDVNAIPVKEIGPAVGYYVHVLGFQVAQRDQSHATLRRVAVRARVRRLRKHEDRGAGVGGRERGGEARNSGSDHEHVVSLAFLPHNR